MAEKKGNTLDEFLLTDEFLKGLAEDQPPSDFIWPGFLAGSVGALVAPGATGKSFFALEAAMAVASSHKECNILGLPVEHHGVVRYVSAEEPKSIILQRLRSCGLRIQAPAARVSLSENLIVHLIRGKGFDIMDDKDFSSLVEYATGCRLVVLDTLSRIHRLDENSNVDMAYLVAQLERLCEMSGAAVLFLHHVNKGSNRDGQTDQQYAARGASSLIDNSRWCGFVAKMTAEEAKVLKDPSWKDIEGFRDESVRPISADDRKMYMRFGVSKQNYDVVPKDRWFRRRSGGVLVPAGLEESLTPVKLMKGRGTENEKPV